MTTLEKLHVGVAGVNTRGSRLISALNTLENVHLHAVCDVSEQALNAADADFGGADKYVDYATMLSKAQLDAVIIATPVQFHIQQAIMALQNNVHVLSEVPAGVSIDECKQLVRACKASKGVYMIAENMNYFKHTALVTELVRKGLFGTTYYAEGEYIHDVTAREAKTPWRREWMTGIDGITYGTHSLGPILQWMPGDRVVSVCCAGSGHHNNDSHGKPFHQDTSVMLCKMQSGGLVKIRLDLVSTRPQTFECNAHQLQGTEGCFESARAKGESHRVWLRSRCDDPEKWLDLDDLADEFLTEWRKGHDEDAKKAEHGGSDFFVTKDFVDSIVNGTAPTLGIHEAMDITLPGLVSQQSIAANSKWLDVPNSRNW